VALPAINPPLRTVLPAGWRVDSVDARGALLLVGRDTDPLHAVVAVDTTQASLPAQAVAADLHKQAGKDAGALQRVTLGGKAGYAFDLRVTSTYDLQPFGVHCKPGDGSRIVVLTVGKATTTVFVTADAPADRAAKSLRAYLPTALQIISDLQPA